MRLTGYRSAVAKTANYTVNPFQDKPQTRFSNRGASGPITFTLPNLTAGQRIGLEYDFYGVAGQNVTVAAPVSGQAIAFNNASCTSLSFSTAGQLIGARIRALWDGTSWQLSGESVGVTYTVA